MEIDDPIAAAAWREWADDNIVKEAKRIADRKWQRARRAYPPSPEEVAAAEYKSRAADIWSSGAAAYGAAMHGDDGGGPMAPLTRHFVQLVGDALRQIEGCNNPEAPQLKVLDAASGPGEPAASIAQEWPDTCVFSADIAPGMNEEAERRNLNRQNGSNLM